jgi:hypothetical protein
LGKYWLRIATFEEYSEISFSGTGINLKKRTEFDFNQVTDFARLYYGKEEEESEETLRAQALFSKIESKAFTSDSIKHHGSMLSQMFKAIGEYLFETAFPDEIKKAIRGIPKNSVLLLDINVGASLIPWEYIFTGENFLCLEHIMGRVSETKNQIKPTRTSSSIAMLVIADPTGDLLATQYETNYIINQLRGSNVRITRFGSEIKRKQYFDLLESGKFEIVHYSGHSTSSVEPGKSHHVFLDGNLYGYEIEGVSSSRMPKLVFCNSCRSGESSFSKEITGNTSLASSYLKAGVESSIGTIWPVTDIGAGDFSSNVYRYLLFGASIGEALLRAKRSSFMRWGFHDLVWASFLLFGDPSMRLITR